MKVRNALGLAAGSFGIAALANRLLESRAADFEPFLEGDQGTYRWRGFDVAYTERGDPEDPDVLLFHGISAVSSSHEFDRILDALADDYHVIAPDVPGFGHSDRPPLLYSASLYSTFVGDVVADLTEDEPIVVASSLTGAYAAEAAGGDDVDVDRLVLVSPTDTTADSRKPWLRALLRSPVVGTALFNLMVSKPSLEYFHEEHGYYDIANLDDDVLEYEWLTAHQEGARFAPASFVSGHLDPDGSLETALADVDAPVTLVWGRNAEKTPLSRGRKLAERSNVGLVVFDRAKLLPHVEHPERFVDVVSEGASVEQ